MKKKLYIIILTIFIILCVNAQRCSPKYDKLKEGDIVFQTSKSNQSKYIMAVTKSPWTHCGIIIEKPDGLFVLEAVEPVKLTLYSQWKSKGRFGLVSTKRYTESPITINYKSYIGAHYDTQFKFNNAKWYCSELIYDIYKNQFNVELCVPHKINDYTLIGVESIMKKRGIQPTQLVVSPSDLYSSKYLY